MSSSIEDKSETAEAYEPFVEGIDFYFEGGLMILTSGYLLERGFCCKNGCRHCPYGFVPDISE